MVVPIERALTPEKAFLRGQDFLADNQIVTAREFFRLASTRGKEEASHVTEPAEEAMLLDIVERADSILSKPPFKNTLRS